MIKKNKKYSVRKYKLKKNTWINISWFKVEKTIEIFQHRIMKATEQKDYKSVKHLQKLLICSFSARLKAVRIVSQEISTKNIPGIDNELWITSNSKYQATLKLRNKVHPKPLKKRNFSKSDDTIKLLNLPCMYDRAYQVLWNMALLPIMEITSDLYSYGFRPYYDDRDVNNQIRTLLFQKHSPGWILNLEIKKFCNILNQKWLFAKIPMNRKILKKWIKIGYFDDHFLLNIQETTFQDGFINLTIINFILNGLEHYIQKFFQLKKKLYFNNKNINTSSFSPNIIRSITKCIIICYSKEQLNYIKKLIIEFLEPRGLKINEKKIFIRHISEGFDFLGWNFRKYSNKIFLCTISKTNLFEHCKEIKSIIKTTTKPEKLIIQLNTRILKWLNYNYYCNSIGKTQNYLNNYLYKQLIKWGKRRHSNKTLKWIITKYWKPIKGKCTFYDSNSYKKQNLFLLHYTSYKKQNKMFLNLNINSFDLKNKKKICKLQTTKKTTLGYKKELIWRKQNGLCPNCNQYLNPTKPELLNLEYNVLNYKKNFDQLKNFILLHKHCHYEKYVILISSKL